MYDQYRQVIPEHSLNGYKSHCWEETFSVDWGHSKYSGHIGKNWLQAQNFDAVFMQNKYSLSFLNRTFPSRSYKSDIACLPNLFVPGFQKSGTTYLYSFLHRLFLASTRQQVLTKHLAAKKEPRFWVERNPTMDVGVPQKSSLIGYLLNFAPGIKQITLFNRKDTILVDGSHNVLFNWPRFRTTENDLTNYCLLPTVLPRLLPDSKFIVIMRNPVGMLYSAFWYSCTISREITTQTRLRGPDTFHDRVLFHTGLFTDCMRDSATPSISHACELDGGYSACIGERLHLLDQCTHKLQVTKAVDTNSPAFHHCGRFSMCIALYYVHIHKWLSIVPKERFHFLTLEALLEDPSKVSRGILGFLDLDTGITANRTLIEEIARTAPTNSQTSINYKADPVLRMRNDTKALLEVFYQPFNTLLAQLLGRELTWK